MQTLQIVQCQALGGETASHEAQKCHLSPIFPDGTIICLNIQTKQYNISRRNYNMPNIKVNNIIFPDGTIITSSQKGRRPYVKSK